MLGCKAGHSMLLEHLAAAASEDADTGATEAPISLQVCFVLRLLCDCFHYIQ